MRPARVGVRRVAIKDVDLAVSEQASSEKQRSSNKGPDINAIAPSLLERSADQGEQNPEADSVHLYPLISQTHASREVGKNVRGTIY
jgi:hypothetical protein